MENTNQNQVISFMFLRRLIGFMGIIFPLILIIGGLIYRCKIQSSISDYYHTYMRDIFVAMLSILSVFLFTYRGENKTDNVLSSIAALLALCIAFFPTSIKPDNCKEGYYQLPWIHNSCATLFFIILGYFSYFIFPKEELNLTQTRLTNARIKTYKISGLIIFASILVIFLYFIFFKGIDFPVVLIFEWVALWAFGASWLAKGEFLEYIEKIRKSKTK